MARGVPGAEVVSPGGRVRTGGRHTHSPLHRPIVTSPLDTSGRRYIFPGGSFERQEKLGIDLTELNFDIDFTEETLTPR